MSRGGTADGSSICVPQSADLMAAGGRQRIQVLQGYDCDIVHIGGKANPTDFLSHCSIQELRSMVDVRATEESMAQRLRFGEEKSTNEDIQHKLDQMFEHGQPEGSSQ